jgi:predicted ribosome quality control (RQC) complex YloA/Tae2 family protein
MSLENYLIEKIVREAAPIIVGQNVGRIFETSSLEFALALRAENACLYISLLPARPGLFLTDRSFKALESGKPPGNFISLLRKYLVGATIADIIKQPWERRVLIKFSSFDAGGAPLQLTLLIDLMGRSANAHLFVGTAYLASLRDLKSDTPEITLSSINIIDRSDGLIAKELDRAKFEELLQKNSLTEIAQWLQGFSPTLTRELIKRAQTRDAFAALQTLLTSIEQPGQARIYAKQQLDQLRPGDIDARRDLMISYFPLEIAVDLIEHKFASINQAADRYFSLLARIEAFQQQRKGAHIKIKNEIVKLEKLLEKLAQESAEFDRAEEFRRQGELILANIGTLRRVGDALFLIDLYHPDQPEIEIFGDANLTPQQVAENLFRNYQRARRGRQAIAKRIQESMKELARKRRIAATIADAAMETDLAAAVAPLAPAIKPAHKQKPDQTPKTPGVSLRRYLSSDGYEILVGRSDASNDYLTFRIGKSTDIWLHAADYPGPHVLIRNPTRTAVPQKTLLEAAQLAAFFSKARGETTAAVRYSERKNVTRPKNAKPGLVLLTHFKTIMVSPKETGQRIL